MVKHRKGRRKKAGEQKIAICSHRIGQAMGDVNRKMGEKTDGGVNEMVKNRRLNMKNIASRPKIGCQV